MAYISPKLILRPLLVTALLLHVADVDSRYTESSFEYQHIENESKSSHVGEIWSHLGKPFRTIHSAYALLLGISKSTQEGGRPIHRPTPPTQKTTSDSFSPATTVLPDRVPATILPSTSEALKTEPSRMNTCLVTAPGSDPELEMRNLRQLEASTCGKIQTRIQNGEAAMPGEFPWLTIIEAEEVYRPGKFMGICGGSLINDRYVLTAAHCAKDHRYRITSVIFGEYNTKTENDNCLYIESIYLQLVNGGPCRTDPPVKLKVECTILHPDYSRRNHPNDIALIRTERPVEFTAYIDPICLPLGEFQVRIKEEPDYGTKLTVAGWGMTMNETRTSIPMKADVPLMDENACKSWHPSMPEKKLCLGEVNGTSACQGDSGGPLFAKKMVESNEIGDGEGPHRRTTRAIQVGVVSVGPNGCQEPSLFTYIPEYLSWLLVNIKP